MVFHRSKIKFNIEQKVLIDKVDVSRVQFIKVLGVIVDENISWAHKVHSN